MNIFLAVAVSKSVFTSPVGIAVIFAVFSVIIGFVFAKFTSNRLDKNSKYKGMNYKLSPNAMQSLVDSQRSRAVTKSLEIVRGLLKNAVIKEEYPCGYNAKRIYTIPLDRQEAILFILAKIISSLSSESEKMRVSRFGADLLGVFDEYKNVSAIMVEAYIWKRLPDYLGNDRVRTLRRLAVPAPKIDPDTGWLGRLAPLSLKLGERTGNPMSVDFSWPTSPLFHYSCHELKKNILSAIPESLLYASVYSCAGCGKTYSVTALEDGLCKSCRKEYSKGTRKYPDYYEFMKKRINSAREYIENHPEEAYKSDFQIIEVKNIC